MKPSSKNEVMNGIVNAYIAQKTLDKANNTHYADTWKILNGADDEIDASLTFDLSEGEWDGVKTYLKANNIAFALCLVSYKDGHSQNSFLWYDDEHIYATEMNEIGSVSFHVADNANKEIVKPTDETSSSILKMLLALENGGANGGGGEVTTKQVFKGGVDILDKPLDVESKATFGADVDVDGALTINSASDLKTKDGTGFGGENIQDIPILDVGENQSGSITGDLKNEIINRINDDSILDICQIKMSGIFLGIISKKCKANVDENNTTFGYIGYFNVGFVGSPVTATIFYIKSSNELNYDFNILQLLTGSRLSLMSYGTGNTSKNSIALTDDWGDTLEKVGVEVEFSKINGSPIVGNDKVADFKVQSTLYRHTITIYEGNTKDGNSICFTAYTPSNTPIDSIQDLTASADGSNKLANTDLNCFGVSGTASALVFYNKIHVGTSITNTTLQKATGGSATLASVYATYTMTDDVTLN